MELKRYQQNTLAALKDFLSRAKYEAPEKAFAECQDAAGYRREYRPLKELPGVPFVCMRVPTGGGKTLMAAHMPGLSVDFLEREHPLVLWMVPTDVIRTQTLTTLRNPDHPNAKALADDFGDGVRVFDITEFADLRRQDVVDKTCIFVATFASLRVTNTAGRRVYAHNENFEPHFGWIPEEARSGMEKNEDGSVKFSFANLLRFLHPLVLVDEAHNNKSALSAETLSRFSPSAILEFTATPAASSNVLYKVSASELKAEGMIKLPIELTENVSPEETIASAIQRRNGLEEEALKGARYIRPVVLFQAETKDREWTVERLKSHLLKEEGIPEREIAVATGAQKELSGVSLFDRDCPIRYIITVEALREGWDCSFAYVLSSLAKVSSATAAEQFLGRVMRMPYVTRQASAALNKAYAFVNVNAWHDSVERIRDQLVSMGFDDAEAAENLEYKETSPSIFHPQMMTFMLSSEPLNFTYNFGMMDAKVEKNPEGGYTASVKVWASEDVQYVLDYAENVLPKEDREAVRKAAEHLSCVPLPMGPAKASPSQKGEPFFVPRLCLDLGGGAAEVVEESSFLPDGFDILSTSPKLDNFYYHEETKTYELDIRGSRLFGSRIEEHQVDTYEAVSLFRTEWTEPALVSWLNVRTRQDDVSFSDMNQYILRVLDFLRHERHMDFSAMVRLRYQLAEALRDTIAMNRKAAVHTNFERTLFGSDDAKLCLSSPMSFMVYPVKSCYHGHYHFQKHYFPLVGDMNGEEEIVAKTLDASPKVAFWVRNLERQPLYAFWLQTSTDKFYPDFVAKLTDGRILVIEHKGGDRISNNDSREKAALGALWERLGQGTCLFLMSQKTDEKGRGIMQQIEEKIAFQ